MYVLLHMSDADPDGSGHGWMVSAKERHWESITLDGLPPWFGYSCANIESILLAPLSVVNLHQYLVVQVQSSWFVREPGQSWTKMNTYKVHKRTQCILSEALSEALGMQQEQGLLYQLASVDDQVNLYCNFLNSQGAALCLQCPDGATQLSTLPVDSAGDTCLFVAAQGAIFWFAPYMLGTDDYAPHKIIENPRSAAATFPLV